MSFLVILTGGWFYNKFSHESLCKANQIAELVAAESLDRFG
jgi:hypothetical protein